jgi:presenilin-like A22 family membrane protease
METRKKPIKISPVFWAMVIFIIAEILTLILVARIDPFLEENNIFVPSQPPEIVTIWPGETTLPSGEIVEISAYSSLGPILIYFFGVAAVLTLVLAFIPLWLLKKLLRMMFAFVFGWGSFIMAVLWLPLPTALGIAAMVSLIWFFIPRVWFHDLALVVALVSMGVVFGRFITPWTGMIMIWVLAVYDILAVRSGLMVWLADKMSQVQSLPAILIPKALGQWGASLKQSGVENIARTRITDRKYSVLGGGDIAFPCLLTASVYFSQGQGLGPGIIMAVAGTLGLAGAYFIQAFVLKGKPMPGLPPIAVCTLIGLLIIQYT